MNSVDKFRLCFYAVQLYLEELAENIKNCVCCKEKKPPPPWWEVLV